LFLYTPPLLVQRDLYGIFILRRSLFISSSLRFPAIIVIFTPAKTNHLFEDLMFSKHLRSAIILLLLLTFLTGVLYPLVVTGLAQIAFPEKANGSLIRKDDVIVGSELIGQPFSDPKYFWGRLSATGPFAYNAGASSGSNYGPLNQALLDGAQKRIQDLRASDSLNYEPIPVDLVTASGSGLDPHISVAAALYQVERVARSRTMSSGQVRSIVDQYTEGRTLGLLGEPRVNVLRLNLALDESQSMGSK